MDFREILLEKLNTAQFIKLSKATRTKIILRCSIEKKMAVFGIGAKIDCIKEHLGKRVRNHKEK